jgi:hypothetical protein
MRVSARASADWSASVSAYAESAGRAQPCPSDVSRDLFSSYISGRTTDYQTQDRRHRRRMETPHAAHHLPHDLHDHGSVTSASL